jgi:DNA invertase Pin-like site-specific DNA recombinase
MKVNYIRVSSIGQNPIRQSNDLKPFLDVCSGSIAFNKREYGSKLIKAIERGEVNEVHVHSIDRLGRNLSDMLNTLNYFESKGVQLISTKESLTLLDSKGKISIVSKLMISVLGSIAEFERERIRERQAEGIAKNKDKFKGRPFGTEYSTEKSLEKHNDVVKLLRKGESLKTIQFKTKKSVPTIIKVKKLLFAN